MKRLAVLIALLAAAPASAADRLTDRDLKSLVERIDQARGRFEDALDSQLKHSVMRGPSGELDVDKFLDDFETRVDALGDRLKPDYSASQEASAVLGHATAIDNYFRKQPRGTKGDSEWGRLAADLQTLAAAYGAAFPLAEGATVRRLTDREVAAELALVDRGAKALKKPVETDLKKDKALDAKTRQAILAEADRLALDAKALRDRVSAGQPSASEADRLLAQAATLKASLDQHPAPSAAQAWADLMKSLQTVAGAYGRSWPAR